MSNKTEKFVFQTVPANAAELMALPEASLDSPFKTTALTILALLKWEENPENCYSMIDALRGPAPMSNYEKQFVKERLSGKAYKVKSFFLGTNPDNGYTPSMPLTIEVSDNPYSYPSDNYATMYVKSSGADNPRPVKLRLKPSTNQWFLNEIQCLSDIRVPKADDPWA